VATVIPENAATFALDEVAEATRGRAHGAARVVGVRTDSRAVSEGALFVALRGERFDAHRFLPDVARAGAGAAVVERGASVPAGLPYVEVDDALRALGDLARRHRERWGGVVVGVTGSVGKTTTKELCRAGLEATSARVLATAGNLNNRVGVPMTLFGLDASHDVAVIEMGTSEPGEIARLAEIGRPDVAAVLQVAEAHTAGFGSLEALADEKTSLFRRLAPGGSAVANADDPRIMARAPRDPSLRTFGASEGADARLVAWRLEGQGTRASYRVHDAALDVTLALLGEAAAINAAAALAVCDALGRPLADFARGLAGARPSAGRFALREGRDGAALLDDTYNASPRSMAMALRMAEALREARGGRLLVVLGDMRELGPIAEAAHRALGEQVAAIRPALFVATGADMAFAADEAARLGARVERAKDAAEAAAIASAALAPGDLVLAKGSRSMGMEAVVGALLPPSEART
jgi:UDP-N-acetylmuramoyl-tripeptide--D-alanyl-D-alanine ligase